MTVLRKGHRTIGLLGATVGLLLASACSGDGQESAPAVSWVTPTSSNAAAADAPKRIEQIASACKLLPAAVVIKVLGGTASTKLSATEAPVEKAGTRRTYTCSYGRGDQEVLALIVRTNPGEPSDARRMIDTIAENSGVQTTNIDELGAAAVSYDDGSVRVLAAVAVHGEELRLLILTAPTIIPQDRLTQLADHVVAQI